MTRLRFVALTVALLTAVGVLAQTPELPQLPGSDLSGVYSCEGRNPDGSPYTAKVEIIKRQDTYLVRWTQENNDEVLGVGIQLEGTGTLAVSYFGGSPAVVVYALHGQKLVGKWTMGGAGRMFDETLTKTGEWVTPKPTKPSPSKPAKPTFDA
jgi:hypothetical protein